MDIKELVKQSLSPSTTDTKFTQLINEYVKQSKANRS